MALTDSSDRLRPGQLASPPASGSGELQFAGVIDRVIYQNRDNGYAILSVAPENRYAGRNGIPMQKFTCVGTLLNPKGGMALRFTGKFVKHARYGRQYAFTSAVEQMPASEAGLIGYLASGLFKGLGPEMAQRIVKTFGEDTLRVIDEEPDRLLKVNGIGPKTLESIKEGWTEHRGISALMQFLQPHGISAAYGVRIYNAYGPRSLDMLQENPYRLAMDIDGIGFTTADSIAEKLGVPRESPLRIQGAVLYILQKASENGDVFLPMADLCNQLEKDLHIDSALVGPALEALELDRRVVVDLEPLTEEEAGEYAGEKAVYLASHYHCESRTAYYLDRLRFMPRNVTFADAEERVRKVLRQGDVPELALAQVEALRMAARSKVMVLTGGPGTGKTTIIKAVISLYEKLTSRIFLAAPTGRAAKRMAESTGREASTLHRLLEFNPVENTFMKTEDDPLACDLLIVDEASMMDIILFYYLMKAVPSGCVVILVGDIHQLPSVGPGSVLADIIKSGQVPVIELTEIFRQSKESDIIPNAHQVNEGLVPQLVRPWESATDFYFLPVPTAEEAAPAIVSLISREIPERFGLDAKNEIQFLTPMHRGAVGTQNMNLLLQEALNPRQGGSRAGSGAAAAELKKGDVTLRVGDKVMQIRNNYNYDVFNGDLGEITDIDRETREITVEFDEDRLVTYGSSEHDQLVLAYAISIHKSQGSEYPAVVIPLFMQHYLMLQRNLVYTAITRGKKLVVLVGEQRAMTMAVQNASVKHRFTRLAWRLKSSL